MNVLIAPLSTLRNPKETLEYEVKIEGNSTFYVDACYTNESILKSFSKLDQIEKSGGINKIIALVSNNVVTVKNESFYGMTAYEYFCECVYNISDDIEICPVRTETDDNNLIKDSVILNEICNQITADDVVYIDSAGAKRTTSNLIQLLVKLLKYKGIINPLSLYADINQKKGFVYDTTSFTVITNIADAMNEFITSGKAVQLGKYLSEKNTEEFVNLIQAMNDFSDNIRLGRITKLDETIQNLKRDIELCEKVEVEEDISLVILKQFLPLIKERLIGSDVNHVDYTRILKWSLDNSLVQQAVTLFVEKIPVHLFKKGHIKYKGNSEEAKREYSANRNKSMASDWETGSFYGTILDDAAKNPRIDLLKEYLDGNTSNKKSELDKAISKLKNIEKYWDNLSKLPEEYAEFVNLIYKNKYGNYYKFVNAVKNENRILCLLLDLPVEDKKQTDEDATTIKKFIAVESLLKNYKDSKFSFYMNEQQLASIFYGYLYAKSVRNQINHANNENSLTVEHKEILKKYGYEFDKYSFAEITDNLYKALNSVLELDKVPEPIKEESKEYKTDLKTGDIVKALCISINPKIVRINGYNYDIQLVIPPEKDSSEYINRTFDVEIKQISKNQKIVQVKTVN